MFFSAIFATGALAYNATTTVEDKVYTTIECSTPGTYAYGNSTYTVTQATTLTVEDCSCTATPTINPTKAATNATAPSVANGAIAGQVGAAAGVAAAVAFLL